MSILYVNSDNRILLSGLTDQSDSTYVNDATVTVTLYEYTDRRFADRAAVVDGGGGTVIFPSSGHNVGASDYFILTGDSDYEDEYQASAVTANTITTSGTYVAKTFNGKEVIAKAIDSARNISMSYIAASNGNYAGIIPDTIKLVLGYEYWVCVVATDTSANVLTIKQRWPAEYHA
jgi:hypothetical protein